jgi:hypothetical protein
MFGRDLCFGSLDVGGVVSIVALRGAIPDRLQLFEFMLHFRASDLA